MSVERLLAPVSWEGIILQLQRTDSGSFRPRRRDRPSRCWVDADMTVGKLMSLPEAAELKAAGISLAYIARLGQIRA